VVSSHSPPHNRMDDTRKVWEYFQQIDELGEVFGVANIHNLAKKVKKVLEERNLYKAELEEFCAIAGLTGIRQRANAKAKFRNLMSRTTSGAAKSYGLDATFLEKVGDKWDNTGGGDTPEKIIRSWEKKIHDQRELVQDAYDYCLRHVEELAREAEYSEDKILGVVQSYHESMVEDFHRLTAAEFWQVYRGDFVGLDVLPTVFEEQSALFEALEFVEEVTPERLYREVRDCRKVIGKVSSRVYKKWEARATEARSTPYKEGREKLQSLMVEIIGLAVHRVYIEGDAIPTAEERSAMFSILAPKEINPYASEFCVGDDTPMSAIAGHYQQLIGSET
jgi:hypothetical protein